MVQSQPGAHPDVQSRVPGEVPRHSALQIRQPASYPACRTLRSSVGDGTEEKGGRTLENGGGRAPLPSHPKTPPALMLLPFGRTLAGHNLSKKTLASARKKNKAKKKGKRGI
uniref:Uncharacterized protein n=1 Tax=Micrurus corallinus TaxID=54390 RepID=A0A2D4FQF2_MICCO